MIDGGGSIPTSQTLVTLSFNNVTGSPDSVRYHWDAVPTDADPWVAFANPITVPAPAGISTAECETHVLYTQVKKGTAQSIAAQTSKIFDTGIQADVLMLNPHQYGLPTFSSRQAQDAFDPANPGANGAWTAIPAIQVWHSSS